MKHFLFVCFQVGGAYGKCGATSMMQEIYTHGPLVAALEVPSDISLRKIVGAAKDHHMNYRDRDHVEVGFCLGEYCKNDKSSLKTANSAALEAYLILSSVYPFTSAHSLKVN